jgi:general secretion pathway protein A
MYEAHWQLESRPFENTLDPRFHYPGETQQGALLKLRYVLENRRGAALLAGIAGLGKTLLAQTLLKQLPEPFSPRIHVVFPQMPPEQLLAYLAGQLTGSSFASTPTIDQCLRRIETRLADNAADGKHAVVVLDEAHVLRQTQALETIRLLLNLEHNGQAPVSFVLVGQTGLLVAVERMPELEERLAVKCLLKPLAPAETSAYVQHRLNAAGAKRTIFSDAALDAIHQQTLGIPRKINRLCDLALLVGFAEELPIIGPEQIESISSELATAKAD